MSEVALWPIALGVLGAVFGSFIATLAIRWPQGRSSLSGRSECDGCGRTLTAHELVPLLSFAALRGRCATCGARIAPSHVITETLGALVGIAAGLIAPGIDGVAGAVFGWMLLALGAIDFAAFWLPNPLTLTLAMLGLASGLAGLAPSLTNRAIGGVLGFGSLWLIAAAYKRLRGRIGLGGGDAKLFGAIGLWLGWRGLAPTLLIAALLGLAVAIATRKAMGDRLPLGTLLAAGGFAMWLAYHWPVTGGVRWT
ncbi:prepilin peptidase [Sphingomonas donggukensis]|uniref:Prepilin leader peptidase/N-methyltransferase n=1 Tax=Sphingomonas donggukensis TaxID=2949093 RepID=A0ABY4TWI9_9SPHN|nr:A24 family peptidase [Sphingomonas donggukensis]URW76717.1 prepilin peptidase [Sphingomonas donggukensis]